MCSFIPVLNKGLKPDFFVCFFYRNMFYTIIERSI
nr:MAG TPA: hypothetical protein [Caudoviricetes sp.]